MQKMFRHRLAQELITGSIMYQLSKAISESVSRSYIVT